MSFEDIITEIQSKPEIWKSSHPGYKNKMVKVKVWRDIAIKVGLEEEILKKRWKHLKDQYRKEVKKKPDSRSGAEADDWVPSWQYFEMMSFVNDEIIPAPTTGNLNTTLDVNDAGEIDTNTQETQDVENTQSSGIATSSQSPQCESQPSSIKPRKRTINSLREDMLELEKKKVSLIEKRLKESSGTDLSASLQNDEDYHFLMSLMSTMKKLTDIQKLRFRGKVNEWLLEAVTMNDNSYL